MVFRQKAKLNKKKKVAFVIIMLWLLSVVPSDEKEDWFIKVTEQMIPVLTYEKQYGNPSVDYAANYQVPDWFYEDETEIMSDTESVTENKKQEEPEKTERVTAPADDVSGTVYTREQLEQRDFLLSHIFAVDGNTSMTEEETNLQNLLDVDLSIDGKDAKDYKILIYHTHGSESFADSREGVKEDTVIGIGSYLAEILENDYGIPVYHDETLYDVIDGQLDRSKAYENAYHNVTKILEENPSIEVVIDLHRDGVAEDTHLVTEINGKPTAKIMFLNGVSRSNKNGDIDYLYNPNKQSNLAFSFQMYLEGLEHYGDYVRKIFVRSYRYNLHLLPRTTLIEAGAQTNTVEEEKNAMEPLAAILYKVLSKPE